MRLQSQYFAIGVRARCSTRSRSSFASKAAARRKASSSAASVSSARSASTMVMRGWSTRFLPNAARWRAWWIAWFSAARIIPATPAAMSKRVWCAISMRVAIPRPGSPTSHASVP